MKINSVFAREILDSRGNPTVEAEVKLEEGFFGRASAPSGASTGIHEAVELRDNEKRYLGKGVLKAVSNVNKIIAPKLKNREIKDAKELEEIDELMIKLDGTKNKGKLGANALTAVSMALRRACADEEKVELYKYIGKEYGNKKFSIPKPMLNIINGGKHAGGKLAIQEFMIVPEFKSFKENLRSASEVYHILGKILVKKYGVSAKNVGDEGGYAPSLDSAEEAYECIMNAIEEAGYSGKIKLAMDAAASSFYENGKYKIGTGGGIETSELLEYYIDLSGKYPIISIEDPFEEEDFDSFSELTKRIGRKVQIVGDDLLVTNPERIETGIRKKSCNALLLKINQIGSVSEAMTASKMCKKEKWNIVVSHRSGETEDSFISDFSVGIGAEYIKTGAPARGERTAKYNQLLRIEEDIIRFK